MAAVEERERKIMGIENGIGDGGGGGGDDDDDDDNNNNNNRINRGGSAVDASVSRRPVIFECSVLVCFQSLT
jgi:hypothetical protein